MNVPNFDGPFDKFRTQLNEALGSEVFQDRRYYDPRPNKVIVYVSGPDTYHWLPDDERQKTTELWVAIQGADEGATLAQSKGFKENDPEFYKAFNLALDVVLKSQGEIRAFNPSDNDD